MLSSLLRNFYVDIGNNAHFWLMSSQPNTVFVGILLYRGNAYLLISVATTLTNRQKNACYHLVIALDMRSRVIAVVVTCREAALGQLGRRFAWQPAAALLKAWQFAAEGGD